MLGGPATEWARNIAGDADGNVYLSVTSLGTYQGTENGGEWDAHCTAISSNGTMLWSRPLWTSSGTDEAHGISVRGQHVYLAGYSVPPGTQAQVRIVKLATDGALVWDLTPNPVTESNDSAISMTVAEDGSIYIVGHSDGSYVGGTSAGGNDAFISKYSSDGTPLWHRLFGSAGDDTLVSCSLGSDGNLYVLGLTSGPFWGQYGAGGTGRDMLVMKWSPTGNCLWHRIWGSTEDDYPWNTGHQLACGPTGIFIVGTTTGSLDDIGPRGANDTFCVKWLYDGTHCWTKVIATEASEQAQGVVADTCGNVFVYLETWGAFDDQTNAGGIDLVLMKIADDGHRLWTRMWGTATGERGIGSVQSDGRGTVHTFGYTGGVFPGCTNAGGLDVTITKWTDPDVDNDLMDDEWERITLGDTSSDGLADRDKDGSPDVNEFTADTSPTDPNSYLAITAITNAPTPTFYYPRSARRNYTLERRDSLIADDWEAVDGQTAVPGSLRWLEDPLNVASQRYYRVKALLP